MYPVKHTDLVPLAPFTGDLNHAPYCYVLYGVKYIDPVSLAPFTGGYLDVNADPANAYDHLPAGVTGTTTGANICQYQGKHTLSYRAP